MIRRQHPLFRLLALGTLAAFLSACATTQLPPISASGDRFEPLPDEIELWGDSHEEEEILLDKVDLYGDEELELYLEELVGRLNPPGMAANPELEFRVRVVEDPALNAFAYPHGSLYVHTGLLARLENEDQLATVLAHEMTHVENRHMLRYRRGVQNRQLAIGAVAIAASIWAASEEIDQIGKGHWGKAATIDILSDLVIGLGLELAILASINGYGRDLELEADQGGFHKLRAAGYDLAQAPRVYEILQDDHGESSKLEVFFFGSHPNLSLRAESARTYLASHGNAAAGQPLVAPDEFKSRLLPVVLRDARLNLEAGRLAIAEEQLLRVRAGKVNPAETAFLFARLHLARAAASPEAAAGLRAEARRELDRAVALDAALGEPWLDLAELAYQDRDYRRACQAFERYLELEPEGNEDDIALAEDRLHELRGKGDTCP